MSATLNETRLHAEAEFERSLREYVLNPRKMYFYGGLTNLIGIISDICSTLAEEYENYDKAATLLGDVASQLDMRYVQKD